MFFFLTTDDNGVVYLQLQARVKFQGAKTFVLALDTSNQLLAAAEFATRPDFLLASSISLVTSPSISKPQDGVLRVPKDVGAWEESSLYEGTESLVLPDVAELLTAGLNMVLRSSEEREPKIFLIDASSVA